MFNETDFGSSGVETDTETVQPNEVVEVGPNLTEGSNPHDKPRHSE